MNTLGFPGNKSIGLLLDPDRYEGSDLEEILGIAVESGTDYILAGGSLTSADIELLIDNIKKLCKIPVILFPGNLLQLTRKADAVMLLSLISGRNPELLIGNHVIAAPYLKEIRERVIPVGYILISCGNKTSVEYMSQTEAIPANKPDIVAATAIAGELLGMKMIYLEGGSGASSYVPENVINAVRSSVSVPLAVGGGIKSAAEVELIFRSGANLVVLGNGCENKPGLLREACKIRDQLRSRLV